MYLQGVSRYVCPRKDLYRVCTPARQLYIITVVGNVTKYKVIQIFKNFWRYRFSKFLFIFNVNVYLFKFRYPKQQIIIRYITIELRTINQVISNKCV